MNNLYKYVDQGDIMKAHKNNAKIFVNDKGVHHDWAPIEEPRWDWSTFDYIIGNKTADGLYLHEFIENVENGSAWYDEHQCLYDESKTPVSAYIKKPELIEKLKLKPKEEFVPFEWEDRKELYDKWFKFKVSVSEYRIIGFHRYDNILRIEFSGGREWDSSKLFEDGTFLDGSVFGKKK